MEVSVEDSTRTFVMEVADASWLEPFVGTHRVQRIPKGERRRHTSTATVAILDSVKVEVEHLDESELDEVYDRGSGKGGQHQNTTDSAVTLTHTPTGISVHIEGRKQWSNRQEARRVLAERVAEHHAERERSARNDQRRSQIDAERAAKSFTHNAQRNEVVDHSTGRTWRLRDFTKGKF